jgi:hypothetical protein
MDPSVLLPPITSEDDLDEADVNSKASGSWQPYGTDATMLNFAPSPAVVSKLLDSALHACGPYTLAHYLVSTLTPSAIVSTLAHPASLLGGESS